MLRIFPYFPGEMQGRMPLHLQWGFAPLQVQVKMKQASLAGTCILQVQAAELLVAYATSSSAAKCE